MRSEALKRGKFVEKRCDQKVDFGLQKPIDQAMAVTG